MASRPIHLAMTGGKTKRQKIWEALRTLTAANQVLTTYAIARKSEQDDETTRTYLKCLAKAEIVSKQRSLPKRDAEWLLVKDEGAEAPRINIKGQRYNPSEGVENIWRALRILRELTAAEAAEQANVNGSVISEDGARQYLQGLCWAGYLTRQGGTSKQRASYRLVPGRDTGPYHPIYQRCSYKQVFDQNLNEVVWRKSDDPEVAELRSLRVEVDRMNKALAEAEYFLAAIDPAFWGNTPEKARVLNTVRSAMRMQELAV